MGSQTVKLLLYGISCCFHVLGQCGFDAECHKPRPRSLQHGTGLVAPCCFLIESDCRPESGSTRKINVVYIRNTGSGLLSSCDFIDSIVEHYDSQIRRVGSCHADQRTKTHRQSTVTRDHDDLARRISERQTKCEWNGTAHRGRIVVEVEWMLCDQRPHARGSLIGDDNC